MNNYKDQVIESRNITEEEKKFIINLLDKYKMDKTNFINNAKTLKINKVKEPKLIVNGYDPLDNIIYYNDKSNYVCELLHVASSKNDVYQGIIVKPNKVYKKPFGFGLNEGITDLFLYRATKKEGYFPFEKICAKVLKYAYDNQIFDAYFKNNDSVFRHQFGLDKDITSLMMNLDEYTELALIAKNEMLLRKELPLGLANATKIMMNMVIEELLEFVKDSKKDCKAYLEKQLKSKTMKPIYDIIGEYEIKD